MRKHSSLSYLDTHPGDPLEYGDIPRKPASISGYMWKTRDLASVNSAPTANDLSSLWTQLACASWRQCRQGPRLSDCIRTPWSVRKPTLALQFFTTAQTSHSKTTALGASSSSASAIPTQRTVFWHPRRSFDNVRQTKQHISGCHVQITHPGHLICPSFLQNGARKWSK